MLAGITAMAGVDDAAMTLYGTWVSYEGSARAALAIVLLFVACLVALAGSRIRRPWRVDRPGAVGTGVLVAMWVVALGAFVVGISIYAGQERRDYPAVIAPPASPIEPVTIIAAIVLAILIVVATGGSERDRVTNGVIAALIAPMVFELPFDLVVMSRTYPPVPPNPAFYRAVFFAPLFLLEITTLSLLVLAPGARMSRVAVLTYALMLGVFAGWALLGFAYPSTPCFWMFCTRRLPMSLTCTRLRPRASSQLWKRSTRRSAEDSLWPGCFSNSLVIASLAEVT